MINDATDQICKVTNYSILEDTDTQYKMKYIPTIKASAKRINYKLFWVLLLIGLVPTIYNTIRIFWLGQMPDGYSFSIAAQLSWINLIYEVIQEAFIAPLFFFIGSAFNDTVSAENNADEQKLLSSRYELANRVRTGLLIVFVVYLVLSIVIFVAAEPLVIFMGQDTAIISQTVAYIRLETIGAIFATLVKFLLVALFTIKKERYLYYFLALQLLAVIILDLFLVSDLNISLGLSINGIALTNIIVNAILFVFILYILYKKEHIKVFERCKLSFDWILGSTSHGNVPITCMLPTVPQDNNIAHDSKKNGWIHVGGISGLESLVRNLVFMLMIIRMVNIVGEQGAFWVANNFIYGWLLLPVVQLGELIKRDCGDSPSNNHSIIAKNTIGYLVITTCIVAIWLATIPLWKPFFGFIGIKDIDTIFNICIISIGFYVLFAYNNVFDSIFYGTGKTNYMLIQSLIINIGFYGIMFALYIANVYVPSLISIVLMFAGGIALDCIVTYFMFAKMLTKYKINLLKYYGEKNIPKQTP